MGGGGSLCAAALVKAVAVQENNCLPTPTADGPVSGELRDVTSGNGAVIWAEGGEHLLDEALYFYSTAGLASKIGTWTSWCCTRAEVVALLFHERGPAWLSTSCARLMGGHSA